MNLTAINDMKMSKKSINSMHGILTDRFEQALVYATQLHRSQRRKLPPVPYVSHLLGVTALVLEDGGDEEEAIAALLHDAIEDQGGIETGREIQRRFGDRVYEIVEACTIVPSPDLSWRSQQQQYLDRLTHANSSVHRVVLADKLHNGRSFLGNFQQVGNETWQYFHHSADDIVWLYQSLLILFMQLKPGWMTHEFSQVVQRLASQSDTFSGDRSLVSLVQQNSIDWTTELSLDTFEVLLLPPA